MEERMKKSNLAKLVMTFFMLCLFTIPVFAADIETEISSASYYITGMDGKITLGISNPNPDPVLLSLPEFFAIDPSVTVPVNWDLSEIGSPYNLPALSSPPDIPYIHGSFEIDELLAADNASLDVSLNVNSVIANGIAYRTGEFSAIGDDGRYVFGTFPQCQAKAEFYFVYYNEGTSILDFSQTGIRINDSYDAVSIGPIHFAEIDQAALATDETFLAAVTGANWTQVPAEGFESATAGCYVFRIIASDFSQFAGNQPDPEVDLSFVLGTTPILIEGQLHFDASNTENCQLGTIRYAVYDMTGLDGALQLELYNYGTETLSIDLPTVLNYDSGYAKQSQITWTSPDSPVSLGSGERIIAYGLFTVDETAAANDSIPISLMINNLPVEGTAVAGGYITSDEQCLETSIGSTNLSLHFSLTNHYDQGRVLIELPGTIQVLNQTGSNPALSYTSCTDGERSDCLTRIQNCGIYQCIYLAQDETIDLSASATAAAPLAENQMQVKTSFRYTSGSELTTASPAMSLGWISNACYSASDLELTANSSEYDTCDTDDGIVHVNYTLANRGTGAITIDLTKIYYYKESVIYSYDEEVTNLTCSLSNTNLCNPESVVIPPGESVTITSEIDTGTRILSETFTFAGRSSIDTNLSIPTLTATQNHNYCEADLNFSVISGTFQLHGTSATISLTILNDGESDAWFVPTNILFHETSASYTGQVSIGPSSKAVAALVQGQRYLLNPGEEGVITATLQTADALTNGQISWIFLTGTGSQNVTGTLVTNTPGQNGDFPDYYWGGHGRKPEMLPGTGFPAGKRTVLPEQPAALAYRNLNGFSIEIPIIDSYAELVVVPQDDETKFSVEWLGDRAGLLEGTALPGEGTSIIAGHNHIDLGNAGPFAFLLNLKENDRIYVHTAEDKILGYSVYANQLVQPDNVDAVFQNTIPGSLVLITCEQELLEGGYQYRRIVYAKPLL
jgi:LPXTG-site transpeptidase (sortase) family protein